MSDLTTLTSVTAKNIDDGCCAPIKTDLGLPCEIVKGEPAIGVPLPFFIVTWKGTGSGVDK